MEVGLFKYNLLKSNPKSQVEKLLSLFYRIQNFKHYPQISYAPKNDIRNSRISTNDTNNTKCLFIENYIF